MKYFITGATGHIGNVLIRELYKQGHQLTALVLPNEKNINIIEPYTNIVYGDITDKSFLKEKIQGYDCVFHLAGIVDIGTGKKKKIYQVNVEGTKNIISACQENNIPKLVYTSSVHAFEEAPKGVPMVEPTFFDPKLVKGNYAKSKAEASNLVLNQEDKGLETIIICPSGVIGPYDYQLSNTGQMFVDYLLGRLTAYIKGSYNFVDVRDLVQGIISASIKGKDKEIYLLSGSNISVKDLLDTIANITGMKKVKTRLARWFILAMSYFAELYYMIRKQKPLFTNYSIKVLGANHEFINDKAKKELGFEVRDISETIADTLTFAKEHYLVKSGKKWRKKSLVK